MKESINTILNSNNERIPKQLLDVLNYINENISKPLKIEDLSNITIWKKDHFSRVFKSYFNMTVYQYILEKRVELAKEMLISNDVYISDIYSKCGFQSYSNFFHAFRKYTSMTPQKFIIYNKSNLYKIKNNSY
jgi:AraC-like DNA-binding protein